MCGICGVFNSKIKRIEKAAVLNMCNAMEHRGPDDLGLWDTETVALGHRRLSIIDLATGHQPMLNEDGAVAVVFNGEIYNYQELREALVAKGHKFKTASDTEVLVHLYEDEGAAMVKQLRGMFAFAIWDDRTKQLFCARDRMGQKPFFYSLLNTHFVFASELSALLSEGSIEKRINNKALYYYMTYGYIPHPMTIYTDVFKLPPAHYMIVNDAGIKVERYWRLGENQIEVPSGERAIREKLYALLLDATKARMISDVPLGAFLSGGIDSSSVVAMMSKLSSSPIKTFSIGFDDPRYNELAYAKRVAEHFGTVHTEFVVKPAMMDVMPELVRRFGEPFADSSCIPTYYVSKLTREHVTVALNGDGADESFAGYDRYLAVVLSEYLTKACAIIPARIWNRVVAALPAHQDQRAFLYRIRRFLSAIKGPFGQRYKRWMSSFSDLDLEQLYLASCHEEIQSAQGSDEVIALLNVSETADVIKLLLGTELQSYLPGDLLVKMDITSMANSLEARSPFLDHTVVEYAWALGSQYKLRGICSKYILKKTFKDILPREILGRKKTGFGVPVRQWFMHELKDYVKEMLLDRDAFGSQYFNCAYIENMVNEHVTGRWNHDRSLWTLVALELWYRHCFKN